MASKERPQDQAPKVRMQTCPHCKERVPATEFFSHIREAHPEFARESSSKGGKTGRKGEKNPGKTRKITGTKTGINGGEDEAPDVHNIKVTKSTHSLIEAAMLEFVGKSIQVPNTPALIYGYFCAKKMGFDGTVGEFLQEVIDDFFESRGINYYKEVIGWETGKTIFPAEPAEAVATGSPLPSGTAA